MLDLIELILQGHNVFFEEGVWIVGSGSSFYDETRRNPRKGRGAGCVRSGGGSHSDMVTLFGESEVWGKGIGVGPGCGDSKPHPIDFKVWDYEYRWS